jgi:hypothetical protein
MSIPTGTSGQSSQKHPKSFERQEKSVKKFKKMLATANRNSYIRFEMSTNGNTPALTFPPDLHRKLEKIAPKTNLSMADVIRLCLALPANCQNPYQSSGLKQISVGGNKASKEVKTDHCMAPKDSDEPGSPPAEKFSTCPP